MVMILYFKHRPVSQDLIAFSCVLRSSKWIKALIWNTLCKNGPKTIKKREKFTTLLVIKQTCTSLSLFLSLLSLPLLLLSLSLSLSLTHTHTHAHSHTHARTHTHTDKHKHFLSLPFSLCSQIHTHTHTSWSVIQMKQVSFNGGLDWQNRHWGSKTLRDVVTGYWVHLMHDTVRGKSVCSRSMHSERVSAEEWGHREGT